MADILIDVEVRGQNSVTSAVKGISTLQNNVKLLSNAFKSGGLSQRQYYKGIKQLADASNKSEKELRKYANTIRAEEKETKKAAAAAKAYASARREALEMDRRITAEKLKSANAARMQASEEERLKSKFVQGHTAMNIYSKELNDLAMARKMDIISAEEQKMAVEQLNVAMKNGTGVFGGYSGGMQGATRKTSRMGVVTQQAGYQVGDFLVQIQSGANPIMAFGQQATQLAGVMTMFGGKLLFAGAALGVLIPLATAIGGVWWAARKAADGASKKTDTFAKALKAAREEVKGMAGDLALLRSGFEGAFEKTFTDAVTAAEKKLKDTQNRIKILNDLTGGGANVVGGKRRQEENENELKLLKKAIVARKIELETAKETAKQLKDRGRSESIINQLHEARIILRQQDKAAADETKSLQQEIAIKRLSIQFGEDSLAVKRLIAQQEREQYKLEQEAIGIRGQALQSLMSTYDTNVRLTGELEKANASASSLAGIDFSNIANGATWAGALADQLARARGAAADKAVGGNVDFFDPRGGPLAGRILKDRPVPKENRPGYVPPKIPGGSGGGSAKEGQDPLGDLLKRIELDTKLLGVSEERAEVMRKLGDDASKYNQDEVDAVVNRLGLYNQEKEALELVQNTQQSIADTLKSSMSEAFMSMVDGTKSFKDAMKDMAKSVIKQLFDILVVQRLVGSFDRKSGKGSGLVGAIMSALPFANGGAFSSGRQIQAYADGGVVGGPTMFPMSGGKTGLMGEAGPEAIMPLKRGKNGKLGVETSGSGSVVVNNNFNIAANGDESVKRIIQGEMPKISEATKRAVVDSKRRGGSYGRSF